jgi:glycosyltransferase involved in cell wall biosynthesis
MKIAVVTRQISPTEGGGYNFTTTLLDQLIVSKHKNHHKIVVLQTGASRISNLMQKFQEKVLNFFFAWSPKLFTRIVSLSTFNRKLRNEDVDFVFFLGSKVLHTTLPYSVFVWDLQHKSLNWFPEYNKNGYKFLTERYYLRVLKWASIVFTGSEFLKNELLSNYGVTSNRIKICKHPVPSIKGLSKKPKTIQDDETFFFYPAQFWAHKNHALVISAIKILLERGLSNFKFYFVGSDKGNLNHIMKLSVEAEVTSYVKYLGFVDTEELNWIYENALAMVYPSFGGPENLPPLEALNSECPVIYAEFEGAKEQLANFVSYFDPFNPTSLADVMQNYLSNSINRKNDLQSFLNNLSPESMVKVIYESFNEFEFYRNNWS